MVRRIPTALLCTFGFAVLAVPIAVSLPCSEVGAGAPNDEIASDPLTGLWSAHARGGEGDPVQFYYFHGDGHGLYRYGKVGSSNTNSFDYVVNDDIVTLTFRKTGARHDVRFEIEAGGAVPVLVLDADPRAGGRRRYAQWRRDPVEHDASAECFGAPLAGRLWLDRTAYATGGYGFGLYQLRCGGIDGRGTGWFHRGDFDDWTTESLVYRIVGDEVELQLATTAGTERTRFVVKGADPRMLDLANDPRDFWHAHRYIDVGPSFGQLGVGDDLGWLSVVAPQ